MLSQGGIILELNLEEEIELLREEMMNTANKKGLTAAETLEFSRRLDNLMDQYQYSGLNKKADDGVIGY